MEFRDVLCEHGSARYAHERSRENPVRFHGLPPADDSMDDRIKHRNFLGGAIHDGLEKSRLRPVLLFRG